jgi:hypothetical protein
LEVEKGFSSVSSSSALFQFGTLPLASRGGAVSIGLKGHGFSRTVSIVFSLRLQPLRDGKSLN